MFIYFFFSFFFFNDTATTEIYTLSLHDALPIAARWPGRLEVIRQDPLTVIDVGHTPDGIAQSLAGLQAIHGAKGWLLVAGASRDKKADKILGTLAPSF